MEEFKNLHQLEDYINSLEGKKEMYWHSKNNLYQEERVRKDIKVNFKACNLIARLRGVKYNKPKQSRYTLYIGAIDKKYNAHSLSEVWCYLERACMKFK